MKRKHTEYIAQENLVVTELSGDIHSNDLSDWREQLVEVMETIPPATKFKMLVDLHGFKAADLVTHKQFREVIPNILASHGWYVGYLRMFPEAEIVICSEKGRHCIAAAHVHHDESKISNYAENYSMKNEAFFTDPKQAREWIVTIPVGKA